MLDHFAIPAFLCDGQPGQRHLQQDSDLYKQEECKQPKVK